MTEPKRENSIRGLPQLHALASGADDPPVGGEGGGDQQLNVLLLAAALGAVPAAWSVATYMVGEAPAASVLGLGSGRGARQAPGPGDRDRGARRERRDPARPVPELWSNPRMYPKQADCRISGDAPGGSIIGQPRGERINRFPSSKC